MVVVDDLNFFPVSNPYYKGQSYNISQFFVDPNGGEMWLSVRDRTVSSIGNTRCMQSRAEQTEKMFNRLYSDDKYNDLLPSNADFPIRCNDYNSQLPSLSYNTDDDSSDRLIPCHAYEHWPEFNFEPFDIIYHKLKDALLGFNEKWDSLFWRGRVSTNERVRGEFMEKFSLNPLFNVSDTGCTFCSGAEYSGRPAYVDLYETCRHRYLIDVPGNFHSGRRGMWQLCGSVLFVVDWQHKEWASHLFLPWVDYVPVKGDFSDLLENFDTVRNNQTLALEIATNCNNKARKLFAQESRDDMTALVLANFWDKYGHFISVGDI